MALLRARNGLWLLGVFLAAFLRNSFDPNSVGALVKWHFCVASITPSGKQCLDTSAFSQ
jgi:hypothetical protein